MELRLGMAGTGMCKENIKRRQPEREVPDSGYICRSFRLTLNPVCVTHLGKCTKRLLTLAWTH